MWLKALNTLSWILVFSIQFPALGFYDSGLPSLLLDVGSERKSGLWANLTEKSSYSVGDSVVDSSPGDLCFAKVLEPEPVNSLFAVWAATPSHPCAFNKIPQQNAVLLRLGKIVSKSGKVMGSGGGKVTHLYEAERADNDKIVGRIQLSTDYTHGVTRKYSLQSLCGDERSCHLALSPGAVLSIEN